VPFRLTPMTHAIHPIKVYEYLAAGLPVVATPMAETAAMQAPLTLASDAAAFAAALVSACDRSGAPGGDAARSARIAWARRHTWDERFERLAAALADAGVDRRNDRVMTPEAGTVRAAAGGRR